MAQGSLYGKDAGITPFWKKFGTFLAVPLHMGPALLLALVAVGGAVAGVLGRGALFLRGIVIFATIRFAFQLFDRFSQGRFDVDSPDIVTWPPKDPRAAKQSLILLFYLGLMLGIAVVTTPKAKVQQISPLPNTSAVMTETAATSQPRNTIAQDTEEAAGNAEGDEDAQPPRILAEDQGEEEAANEPALPPMADAAPAEEPSWFDGLHPPWWFWPLALLCAIPLPASTIVLALEHSLIKALSPFHTLAFLRAMGSSYFILFASFATIVLIRIGIESLDKKLPAMLFFPLEGVTVAFLTMVLYAMLGYVLYQYHDELGLEVAIDTAELARTTAPLPQDPLERKLQPLLAAGKIDAAIEEVKDEMRYDRTDVGLNRRLHELYVAKGDPALIVRHGHQFLDGLIRAGNNDEAFDLLTKLEGLDATFAPADNKAILPLAIAAHRRRHFQKALTLLKGFDRRYPNHPHIPDVYLLGAKLCSEFLRNDKQSIAILQALLTRFPESLCIDEAKAYLAVLQGTMPTKVLDTVLAQAGR